MGLSIHKLQFTAVHQLRDMPNMKLLNTFPKLDKIIDQTNFRVPKNKPSWQSGIVKMTHKCKQTQANKPQEFQSWAKGSQSKLSNDTQRKRTVFLFSESKVAEKISGPSGECRKRTVNKGERKTKMPRRKTTDT